MANVWLHGRIYAEVRAPGLSSSDGDNTLRLCIQQEGNNRTAWYSTVTHTGCGTTYTEPETTHCPMTIEEATAYAREWAANTENVCKTG